MAVYALCMRSTNLHWCVLGLCISFERSQPLVEILKLIKEQLQQKIFSSSANNYLASHGAKTFILSLLKTLLHSNVFKPFLNSKTHREHYSHFNSKKSVFCLPRKKRRKTHLSLKECFRRLDLIFLRLPFASDFSPIQSKIYAMSQHDQVSNLFAEDPKWFQIQTYPLLECIERSNWATSLPPQNLLFSPLRVAFAGFFVIPSPRWTPATYFHNSSLVWSNLVLMQRFLRVISRHPWPTMKRIFLKPFSLDHSE